MAKTVDLLALAAHEPALAWDAFVVENAYNRIQLALLRHVPALTEAASQGRWAPGYDARALAELCGDVRSSRHAFAAPALDWGFNLSEPQVTAALAHFLSASQREPAQSGRCAAFLRALYRAAGVSERKPRLDLFPDRLAGPVDVQAERPIGSRRVDIALEWKEHGKQSRMILIECKFNHHITPGQLPAYRQFAKRKVDDGSQALFVIVDRLAGRTARAIARNKDWIPLTWRALVRRLEQELESVESTADSADFARLRRTIWAMGSTRSF